MSEPRFPPGEDGVDDPAWLAITVAIALGLAVGILPLVWVWVMTS
jgi:hypothetical protein